MSYKDICCLIPAYNEEQNIGKIVEGCKKYIDNVVVVDDGSIDRTAEVGVSASAEVIRHPRNLGKGMALRTGFSHIKNTGVTAVITLDADGQHDPAEIIKFIDGYKNNFGDIIIGDRLWDKGIPLYRYIPNKIGVYFISRTARCKITDTQSGYRLYRREVIEKINLKSTGFETETEILIKAGRMGFRINSIPVKAIYPEDYKTNFKPIRDFYKISVLFLRTVFRC